MIFSPDTNRLQFYREMMGDVIFFLHREKSLSQQAHESSTLQGVIWSEHVCSLESQIIVPEGSRAWLPTDMTDLLCTLYSGFGKAYQMKILLVKKKMGDFVIFITHPDIVVTAGTGEFHTLRSDMVRKCMLPGEDRWLCQWMLPTELFWPWLGLSDEILEGRASYHGNK